MFQKIIENLYCDITPPQTFLANVIQGVAAFSFHPVGVVQSPAATDVIRLVVRPLPPAHGRAVVPRPRRVTRLAQRRVVATLARRLALLLQANPHISLPPVAERIRIVISQSSFHVDFW